LGLVAGGNKNCTKKKKGDFFHGTNVEVCLNPDFAITLFKGKFACYITSHMKYRCILLFFQFLFSSLLFSQTGDKEPSAEKGAWTKKADFPGSSRNDGIGFSIGTKGYFGLGQKQVDIYIYKSYTDFWEYDSETNTWTQKSDFPGKTCLGTKGFLVNGKIYAGFGYVIAAFGSNAGSNEYQTDLYAFDPDSNKWSKKNDKQIEGGSIFFTIQDTVYAVNPEYRILRKYNPLADSWTESNWTKKAIAPNYMNLTGNDISFSVNKNEFFIATILKKGNYINQLWEFDPQSIIWSRKNDLPVPGNDTLCVFSIGEKEYVRRGVNDFLEYDPSADAWTTKKEIPVENKYFSPTFSIGEKIYGFSKHKFWEFTP